MRLMRLQDEVVLHLWRTEGGSMKPFLETNA